MIGSVLIGRRFRAPDHIPITPLHRPSANTYRLSRAAREGVRYAIAKQVILTAVEDSLAEAWRRFCGDLEFVRVHRGSILDIPCDAIVSPANSFGFMDGGIDFVYMRHFGPGIEERVQSMIRERHQGELLVGSADMVDTEDPSVPYLIVAPTMRVPMPLTDSVNPYLAAPAVFRLVKDGRFSFAASQEEPIRDRIRTVALPGLGTGSARSDRTYALARYGRRSMTLSWIDSARLNHGSKRACDTNCFTEIAQQGRNNCASSIRLVWGSASVCLTSSLTERCWFCRRSTPFSVHTPRKRGSGKRRPRSGRIVRHSYNAGPETATLGALIPAFPLTGAMLPYAPRE
jgi:O-acetyl-ADP-ribose deacetylase (regulator of RNase III)